MTVYWRSDISIIFQDSASSWNALDNREVLSLAMPLKRPLKLPWESQLIIPDQEQTMTDFFQIIANEPSERRRSDGEAAAE